MTSRREQFRAIFLATVMVVSMVAMGATALAGSAAADVEEDDIEGDDLSDEIDIGFSSDATPDSGDLALEDVSAGTTDQELVRFHVQPDSQGVISSGDDFLLTLPDGMTFSEGADDLSAIPYGNADDDDFGDVQIIDDRQSLEVEIDSTLGSEDNFRISGLAVDVEPDFESSFEGETAEVHAESELEGDFDFADVYNAKLNPGSESSGIPAGSSDDLETAIPATPDMDQFDESNSVFSEGDTIVLMANETEGISFDTEEFGEDDVTLDWTSEFGNVSVDSLTVSEQEVTVEVNDSFEPVSGIFFDGLVGAAGVDADDDSTLELEVRSDEFDDAVSAESDYTIDVLKPELEYLDQDNINLGVGIDDQDVDADQRFEYNGDETFVEIESTNPGQIEAGQNVTLQPNQTDTISFNESMVDDHDVYYFDDSSVENLETGLHVTDDGALTFNVTDDDETSGSTFDGSLPDGDSLLIGTDDASGENDPLSFDVDPGVPDDTTVELELLTGDEGNEVTTTDEDDTTITLQTPDTELDQAPFDPIPVDDAGASGLTFDDDDALEITGAALDTDTDVQIADGTNVTVEIETGTGVEFDERAEEGDLELSGVEFNSLSSNELDVTATGDVTGGATVSVGAMPLNVTDDATDATLTITTDTSDNEGIITTTDIETQDVDADQVAASDDKQTEYADYTFSETLSSNTIDAGEPETTVVAVANESEEYLYGGANVDLEVEEHPEGADEFDVDLLNTTSVTTAAFDGEADGSAAFNFTGTVAGDYVVNATVDDDTYVNIEYEVEAGDTEAIEVDGIENAFEGQAASSESDDVLRTGVFNVTLTDDFGSLVADDAEIEIIPSSDDMRVLEVSDDISNGEPMTTLAGDQSDNIEGTTLDLDDISDGHFYVFTDRNNEMMDAELSIETVGDDDDVEEDSGTVNFYDDATEDANLVLEDDSIAPDETENTTVTASVETEDGTSIEVPRMEADLEITNDSVALFEANDDSELTGEETDRDGEITANVTGLDEGDTDLEVAFEDERDVNEAFGTTTLEVADAAPDFQIIGFDDVTITEDDEATVEVDVENEGDAEGTQDVVVEVDGEDISASEELTLDAGASDDVSLDLATEDLSADEYDMTAMTDDDTANATLTVEEPTVELDVTLDDVTIDEGDTADIDVDVENTGDLDAEEVDVELAIDDGDITVDDTVDVDAGDTETVSFEDVATDDLDADEYDMEATAEHDDVEASDTATLTVEEEDGIPGFTAGIAALALLGAALLALRLRDQE